MTGFLWVNCSSNSDSIGVINTKFYCEAERACVALKGRRQLPVRVTVRLCQREKQK